MSLFPMVSKSSCRVVRVLASRNPFEIIALITALIYPLFYLVCFQIDMAFHTDCKLLNNLIDSRPEWH